jgi:hypothetical protein
VFFDPDKGFEIESCPRGRRKAAKFVYYDEIVAFVRRGQSVVVYQHLDRRKDMVDMRLKALEKMLPDSARFAVRARFGTGRAYVVVAAARHATLLRKRAAKAVKLWTHRGQRLLHFQSALIVSQRVREAVSISCDDRR